MENSITLPKLIFSKNFINELKNLNLKKKFVLFTSSYWEKSKIYKTLIKELSPNFIVNNISPNPSLDDVIKTQVDFSDIDYCISLGGGSVIDFSKAVLAFYSCKYKKKYFKKALISNKPFLSNYDKFPQIIAIPTTSGTGSEVNSWGTIWKQKEKLSVAGNILKPTYAILDANLCKTMPKELTISSALDALSHAFESIWNINYTYITDEISALAIKKIFKFLRLVIMNKDNIKYRKELQIASLLAGISMSQTKTALCHSISYPLTSIYNIPHGIACSLTLAEVANLNNKKNKKRMKVLADALYCNNNEIDKTIKEFLISIKYKEVFRKFSKINIDKNINFINPLRAKNNLTKVSNKLAIEIVKKSISQYS